MINNNNYSAIVIFLLVILVGAVAFGDLLNDKNIAEQKIGLYPNDQSNNLDNNNFSDDFHAIATPTPDMEKENAIHTQMALAIQGTATYSSIANEIEYDKFKAAKTAIAWDNELKGLVVHATQAKIEMDQQAYRYQVQATATQMVLLVEEQQGTNTLSLALYGMLIVICIITAIGLTCLWIFLGREREKLATAEECYERRRMIQEEKISQENVFPFTGLNCSRNDQLNGGNGKNFDHNHLDSIKRPGRVFY